MRLIFFALFLSLASVAQPAPLPKLNGDAEATTRIEKMLARMGGREKWAKTRTYYIVYQQYHSGRRMGVGEERSWRDVSVPGERLELWRTDYEGHTPRCGHAFNKRSGWIRQPEGLRDYSSQELADNLKFWKRDVYTMFHRMAAGDAALSYRFTAPNRIDVTEGGENIGWWEVDRGGTFLRWGVDNLNPYNPGSLSYIYGPYKKFGDISFPAWGASSDGLYRFEYLEFLVSPNALPDAVFDNPAAEPPAELKLR
jgi:hypothetical protein